MKAGVLAGLASAVHVDIAVALVLACSLAAGQAIWRKRDLGAPVAPAIAPIDLLACLIYLQVWAGSWANWRRSEKMGWHQRIDFGSREIHVLASDLRIPLGAGALVGLTGAVAAIVLVIALGRRPLPAPATAMALTVLTLSFVSSDVGLRPRAVLAAAPAFVSLAGILNDRENAWWFWASWSQLRCSS